MYKYRTECEQLLTQLFSKTRCSQSVSLKLMAEVQSSVYLLGYKLYVLFLEFTFKVKQDEVLYQKKMNTNECFRGTKEVGVQELS